MLARGEDPTSPTAMIVRKQEGKPQDVQHRLKSLSMNFIHRPEARNTTLSSGRVM